MNISKEQAEELLLQHRSPLYVYDAAIIKEQYQTLVQSIAHPNVAIHYACKANTNQEILEILRNEGCKIEAVSRGEVEAAYQAGFKAEEIIFTCSNVATKELHWVIDQNIHINLDSLAQIEKFGKHKPNSTIAIRINQGIGAGHHDHVITGGPNSKFGIDIAQLEEAKKMADTYGLIITGIHQHIGSGVLNEDMVITAIEALLKTAEQFENLEKIDLGGGFGVPYKPDEKPLNMELLGQKITKVLEDFTKKTGTSPEFAFEPGRYLVAESGTLLCTVTEIKKTPHKIFVGVDTGFNHLIRPAMYGSYHHITNLSSPENITEKVTLAGNICESGDVFAKERELPLPQEGNILAIHTTGAYGYVMASTYNSRKKPLEIVINR